MFWTSSEPRRLARPDAPLSPSRRSVHSLIVNQEKSGLNVNAASRIGLPQIEIETLFVVEGLNRRVFWGCKATIEPVHWNCRVDKAASSAVRHDPVRSKMKPKAGGPG